MAADDDSAGVHNNKGAKLVMKVKGGDGKQTGKKTETKVIIKKDKLALKTVTSMKNRKVQMELSVHHVEHTCSSLKCENLEANRYREPYNEIL